ncbi:hypothetical protein QBC43DRAFT_7240 [Cladorrhinum sp. PSN259]|nr:hypothetical protein QBC43DRAFT_7240 [Cladorrhinum sp. PSN259]
MFADILALLPQVFAVTRFGNSPTYITIYRACISGEYLAQLDYSEESLPLVGMPVFCYKVPWDLKNVVANVFDRILGRGGREYMDRQRAVVRANVEAHLSEREEARKKAEEEEARRLEKSEQIRLELEGGMADEVVDPEERAEEERKEIHKQMEDVLQAEAPKEEALESKVVETLESEEQEPWESPDEEASESGDDVSEGHDQESDCDVEVCNDDRRRKQKRKNKQEKKRRKEGKKRRKNKR